MNNIPYASNDALVRIHVNDYLSYRNGRGDVFQRMATSIAMDGVLSPADRRKAMQILSHFQLSASHEQRINQHPLIRRNSSTSKQFEIVDSLCTRLFEKVRRRLTEAGLLLVTESPAYIRSSRFSVQDFCRLTLIRSFSEPAIRARWRAAASLAKAVASRLALIHMSLNCVDSLFNTDITMFGADRETTQTLNDENSQIVVAIKENVRAVEAIGVET